MFIRSHCLDSCSSTCINPCKCLDHLARNWFQYCCADGMAKVCNTVSVCGTFLPLCWKDNPMYRAFEQVVGPITQQIANVDQDRRRWVIFGSWWKYWNRCPGGCRTIVSIVGLSRRRDDLQTRLTGPLEQERDRTVIRMGSCSDVDFWSKVGLGWYRRVVEESKGASAWSSATMPARKPV